MHRPWQSLTAREYEQLARLLAGRIARRAPVTTTRLEHDVKISGRATTSQVDVVWEFSTASGHMHRVVFECRKYGTALKQKDVFAFKAMVDDISDPAMTTTGVMITTTGYQSGARAIADTYGVMILELRDPQGPDLENRVVEVRITARAKVPHISDLNVEAVAMPATGPQLHALNHSLEIETPEGQRVKVLDMMLEGELTGPDDAVTSAHPVERTFDPPAALLVDGDHIATVRSISATVQEVLADPFDISVGGRERLAWMVKDTLNGDRIWFTHDGGVHATEA